MSNASLQELADGKIQNVRFHSSRQNLLHRSSQLALNPEKLLGSIMLPAQMCMTHFSRPFV